MHKWRKNMAVAAYGLYKDRLSVAEVVDSLKQSGFRNTDISVLLPEVTDKPLPRPTKQGV